MGDTLHEKLQKSLTEFEADLEKGLGEGEQDQTQGLLAKGLDIASKTLDLLKGGKSAKKAAEEDEGEGKGESEDEDDDEYGLDLGDSPEMGKSIQPTTFDLQKALEKGDVADATAFLENLGDTLARGQSELSRRQDAMAKAMELRGDRLATVLTQSLRTQAAVNQALIKGLQSVISRQGDINETLSKLPVRGPVGIHGGGRHAMEKAGLGGGRKLPAGQAKEVMAKALNTGKVTSEQWQEFKATGEVPAGILE